MLTPLTAFRFWPPEAFVHFAAFNLGSGLALGTICLVAGTGTGIAPAFPRARSRVLRAVLVRSGAMSRAPGIALMLLLLSPVAALASGMVPFCQYSTNASGLIENARYRLHDAWTAADLVAVAVAPERATTGQPQPVKLRVVVKGPESGRIDLVAQRCAGTACRGLAVPPGTEFLLLLRRLPDGTFHKVDGEGNDACPSVFLVTDGAAQIGDRQVPVPALRRYFEQRPPPIAFPGR